MPVGLPYAALPLTTALSLLSFPITMLELAGVVVVDDGSGYSASPENDAPRRFIVN
ncbi:MAG: hypothetical protein WAM97_10250 [Acidimicrobiales bacterium]